MQDAPPLLRDNIYPTLPSSPTSPPTPNVVRLPIHRQRDGTEPDGFMHFVPYENPAVFDVQPSQWHRTLQGIFLFRYTDYRGWPAVQPTGDWGRIEAYFQSLADEGDESCDKLLLEIRLWCC